MAESIISAGGSKAIWDSSVRSRGVRRSVVSRIAALRVSVEQNLRTYVRTLRHLPLQSGGPDDFSILRHIQGIDGRDQQPWLFLPSPLRAKHTSIKPLLTCWLDCAVAALLSCGEQRDRRCWFIVDEVVGIGIDYREIDRPPELFADAYAEARRAGLKTTAHAGEFGMPWTNVRTAVELLKVDRVDHGGRSGHLAESVPQ